MVITRRSWKPFVREGAWVRIPPPAFRKPPSNNWWFSYTTGFGEVPKRLKGLPWKGSRSLIAVRGFKSRLLRLNQLSYRYQKKYGRKIQRQHQMKQSQTDNEQWNLNRKINRFGFFYTNFIQIFGFQIFESLYWQEKRKRGNIIKCFLGKHLTRNKTCKKIKKVVDNAKKLW